ncbi:WxL domain-containing protein [Enterococcus sp. LJL99]
MKNSYKLAGAALLAAVGVGLTVPSVTKADPNVTSKGKVEFTQDTNDTDTTEVTPDSSNPIPITEPTINPDKNPLKIRSVTDLDFDTHEIVSNETAGDKVYPAKAFATTKVGTTDAVKTSHFVSFQDIRQDTDTNFHAISAKITKQFTAPATGTAAERKLDGATIAYKNAHLMTSSNPGTQPSAATVTPTFTLNDTDTATVYTNKETGKGYGKFKLVFGEDGNLDDTKAEAYDSVELHVPGTNVVKTGQYEAEITWSIVDAN